MSAYLNACRATQGVVSQGSGLSSGSKIVIVGAGAAGLSAAYYLKKAGVNAQVYEASPRLGGRIFTQYDFNNEKMFCERGGELINTDHKEIQDLMAEFGLELERLPDEELRKDVQFFEGQWKSEHDLIEAFRPMAKRIAKDAENFVIKDEFTMPTFENPISDRVKLLDRMSLKTYLDQAIESPKWVREMIRVAYVGEYGLEAEEQSAINLVTFIGTDLDKGFQMLGESDELFRIKGGNSRLTQALGEAVGEAMHLEHSLKSIAIGSGGRLQLLFEARRKKAEGKVVEVLADHVILAVPFTVLRGIKGIDSLGLKPRKLQAIRELGYGTNTKLMLGFTGRFWRQESQSYPANDGNVVSELPFQGGWDTSRKQAGDSGIFTNFMGGKRGAAFTQAQAKETLRDLNTLYPGIGATHDGNIALQVWSAVETAKGSYICQTPGQFTMLGGSLNTPELNGRLLFAGEHTSDVAAGFMNGAVESGLRVATQYLHTQSAAQPAAKKA
ncbi:MAG: NAD(P)/FAD-dependent oxidoreductase [Bdellovibrionota bacterium]